jgi:hypothetical protein
MTINPNEAADSLQHIAAVERRTREAMFYGGSSLIFIMWGVLVAGGHAFMALYPHWGAVTWLVVTAVGCAATALIIAVRMRATSCETRDWRIVWAMAALAAYGAVWSYLLGPIIPRPMIYAFQPSLFMLGMILAGFWVGRFFIILGLAGIALLAIGYLQAAPWLQLWMAVAPSATLILGGVWLYRNGVPR